MVRLDRLVFLYIILNHCIVSLVVLSLTSKLGLLSFQSLNSSGQTINFVHLNGIRCQLSEHRLNLCSILANNIVRGLGCLLQLVLRFLLVFHFRLNLCQGRTHLINHFQHFILTLVLIHIEIVLP